VCTLFVSLPFGEAETQRPDIGQIASREHIRSRWNRGGWCAVFDSVSKIWMDLLFDITSSKTVIILAVFTRENCPDVTCRIFVRDYTQSCDRRQQFF
jgi:hypothetical protein